MVDFGLIGQAAGMFAATNVDDLVLLALFFANAAGRRGALRVVAGQYLGFAGILAVSIVGALGAGLLPDAVLPWLGLVPLLLGLRAAWRVWRERGTETEEPEAGPGVLAVAGVTFANGGDNIGVYVPVFANTGTGGLIVYAVVFLALVAVWCLAGRFFATRPAIARALARWGHLLLPVVLIAIGLLILLHG
ncbi:cadmium transporter [Amycolatopsis sp. WAC 01375]|nr:cadmium transporter [Amycolatopsis sp. WAC 01375]